MNKDTYYCKICGSILHPYGNVRRIVKSKYGRSRYIFVKRVQCRKCGKIFRSLPDFLLPYKHYEADIIIGVVEGLITSGTLGFEDYPCELTMKNWARNLQFAL